MDLLKAEIERKRKAVDLAKSSREVGRVGSDRDGSGSASARGGGGGRRQYLKAADLRRFQERQEEAEEEERRRRVFRRRGKGGDGGARKRRREGMAAGSADDSDDDDDGRGGGTESGVGAPDSRREAGGGSSGSGDGAARSDGADGIIGGGNETRRRRDEDLSPEEVTRMLRELGLPVRLFGERTVEREGGGYDDARRLDRLHEARENRKAAMAGMSEMDEFRLGSGHGIRNPFLGGRKRGGDDEGEEDDILKRAKMDATAGGKSEAAAKSSSTAAGSGVRDDKRDGKGKDDDDEDDPHKRIYRFFKNLLRQWEDDLARRPDAVKRTAAGRNDTKTVKQCKDYIRPLFKLCKKRTLEPGMMTHITKIVDCCEKGEFVQAHDAYMDLAIGRAAWPMGVTMVGIHARSGREKISSSNVAHVMNSELQRKYLTSVKRLMSYYQRKRTDVDPSKKVLNM